MTVPASMDADVVRELREMDARNPGVLRGLLRRFIAELGGFLADLRCQPQTLDLDFVRAGAHRLKGGAGSLGARALAARAGRVEQAAMATDSAQVGAELAGLVAEFELVVPLFAQVYGLRV